QNKKAVPNSYLRHSQIGKILTAMKKLSRNITVAAAIGAIAVAAWFTLKRYDCKRRNAAYRRQIESIEHAAHEQLRIGTKKADVSRFFDEHNIPLSIVKEPFETSYDEAMGTLYTSGCAPFGCGSDRALIGVSVQLDAAGNVTGEPKVVGLYMDCL